MCVFSKPKLDTAAADQARKDAEDAAAREQSAREADKADRLDSGRRRSSTYGAQSLFRMSTGFVQPTQARTFFNPTGGL